MMKQRKFSHRPMLSRSTQSTTEDSPQKLFADIGKSVLLSISIAALLLLLLSCIAYFQTDADAWTAPLGVLGSAVIAFVGGIIAVRLHRHSALLCGLLNGSCMMALMLLLSLFFLKEGSGYSTLISTLLHVGFLLLSILGAYVGLPRQASPKRKRVH